MTRVTILGAGAFGSALAVALAQKHDVRLWGRGLRGRQSSYLPGVTFDPAITVCGDMPECRRGDIVLLAIPMQAMSGFLAQHATAFAQGTLVACCKGVDLATGHGPTALIARACPDAVPAILTGPSFATDMARGMPTALTIACENDAVGTDLREHLSTKSLRLYSTTDVTGAELGGALKNVIAIAAGVAIGAGLGESARAAVMTRGYAEMVRLAVHLGAQAETIAGLSGLGDLVLTCTSLQSRNFRHGMALGGGQKPAPSQTVEGVATAQAVGVIARRSGIGMPIADMVAALTTGRIHLQDAITHLLSRPLKPE